jgi:hypothetical protein
MITSLLILCGAVLFTAPFAFYRLHCVDKERRRILNIIKERAEEELEQGIVDWERFYERFNAISFDRMLLQFWKPARSFYDMKELLK